MSHACWYLLTRLTLRTHVSEAYLDAHEPIYRTDNRYCWSIANFDYIVSKVNTLSDGYTKARKIL
jgi:hypothetical protein